MANFRKAYKKTMGYEGGYVNDPVDFGKETYKGISRKYNPNWAGWKLIDFYKDSSDFPSQLKNDTILQDHVKALYKKKYWDTFFGDRISDQSLANKLFDISVNMGSRKAVKFLQVSLNILNRNEKLYKNLDEDSQMGNKTHTTLEYYLSKDNPIFLMKLLNILQGTHYVKRVMDVSSQKKFIRGWLSRINL